VLRRNIAGTSFESSFKDRLRNMISVRTAHAPSIPPPPSPSFSNTPPQRNESRVIIDLGEVLQQDADMHRQILNDPRLQVCRGCAAALPRDHLCLLLVMQPQVPVWEKAAETLAHEENPEYMTLKTASSTETETRKLHVGFDGQLGTHVGRARLRPRTLPHSRPPQLLNPRTLRSHHLNQLVAIDGIVTKVGLVRPKLEKIVQYCEATGSMEVSNPALLPPPP
jgi:DNA replicative helicase MCM subunit Mcm2 (Cdc46/Mcm family)